MTYQDYFNISLAIAGFLGGWWMKAIWGAIKRLEDADRELLNKMNSIQVLIAGEYAKKEEFNELSHSIAKKLSKIEALEVMIANHYVMKSDFSNTIEALFKKLDRIEEKLDKKADK